MDFILLLSRPIYSQEREPFVGDVVEVINKVW